MKWFRQLSTRHILWHEIRNALGDRAVFPIQMVVEEAMCQGITALELKHIVGFAGVRKTYAIKLLPFCQQILNETCSKPNVPCSKTSDLLSENNRPPTNTNETVTKTNETVTSCYQINNEALTKNNASLTLRERTQASNPCGSNNSTIEREEENREIKENTHTIKACVRVFSDWILKIEKILAEQGLGHEGLGEIPFLKEFLADFCDDLDQKALASAKQAANEAAGRVISAKPVNPLAYFKTAFSSIYANVASGNVVAIKPPAQFAETDEEFVARFKAANAVLHCGTVYSPDVFNVSIDPIAGVRFSKKDTSSIWLDKSSVRILTAEQEVRWGVKK